MNDAIEELELWHQVWDDTVLATLDYVEAVKAADQVIHFRTPSSFGPGQVIQWNPATMKGFMLADYRRKLPPPPPLPPPWLPNATYKR